MKTYITDHYIFNYEDNSIASNDIKIIANEQETSFNKICKVLKVNYPEKIKYFLFDSPLEVGKLYGIEGPINGFAIWGKNEIYAVYNQNTKCIGPHEDAHIISFLINDPDSYFIAEGLAMYFDEKWWSIENDIWSSYYKDLYSELSICSLLSNEHFDSYDCKITYPIAGAFTKYLIDVFGIDKYIELYKIKGSLKSEDFKEIFNYNIHEIDNMFWNIVSNISYDNEYIKMILANK